MLRPRGFTLAEVLVAVALAALLATLAVPMLQEPLRKSRRTQAVAALTQAQTEQEQWRANHREYDTRAQLMATASAAVRSHYLLANETAAASAETAYRISATARAASTQAQDRGCQFLAIEADGAAIRLLAGASAAAASADASAQRCWGRL